MDRFEELQKVFDGIDENQKSVILPLLEECVFMENQLRELKKLPQIRIHPTNPARQEITAAGKQYKIIMQSYNSAIKTLLTCLYRSGADGDDELLNKLREFEA